MTEYDIVIVGAGAAGLGAAKRLQALGRSFVVLEAKDRIGGRAFTDTATFGTPWDRGGHWLHSASVNPLRLKADELGIAYLKREGSGLHRNLHLGTGWADRATLAMSDAEMDAQFAASDALGAAGHDVPVKDAFDVDGRWYRLMVHWSEAISGVRPEEISTLDYHHYSDTEENWPVVEGYGALVAACGAGVPVSLKTPVSEIDWSGKGVQITTPQGVVKAKAVIVTVSTNVLSAGAIKFTKALPAALQTALHAVPTGYANKIGIQFSRDVFGLPDTSHATLMDERDPARHAMSFQIRPFGQELAIAYLGGDFAREMEAAGEAASFDLARAALADMFGHDILKSVTKMAATAWGTDPHMLGAYSCALPGGAAARGALMEPLDGKVFLAGEAVHATWFSTIHGAWVSGEEAAARATKGMA
jgi:monoamine oxidase